MGKKNFYVSLCGFLEYFPETPQITHANHITVTTSGIFSHVLITLRQTET